MKGAARAWWAALVCFVLLGSGVGVCPEARSALLGGSSKGDVLHVYRDERFVGGIPLFQETGVTYVFLSDMALVFRGTLHWFQTSGRVRLAIGRHWVDFSPGEATVSVEGDRSRLDHPLVELQGKVALPLSFLSSEPVTEALGYRVEWDSGTQTLELTSSQAPEAPTVQIPVVPSPPAVSDREKPSPERATPRPGRRLQRIVIDAGHGGHDPGALGYRRTKEKDMTLLFAKELARTLRERGRYEVFLSREDDTFVPLADRARFANERQADLFLSIHCNYAPSRSARGFEIYFLSEKASDPQAEAVARFENSVIELEAHSPKERQALERLFRSLLRTDTINESSELCGVIARQVEQRMEIESRGVKQAGFYVLRGTEMPAALVELGFLSNAGEERDIRSRQFRQRMVQALLAGVRDFDGRLPVSEAKGP